MNKTQYTRTMAKITTAKTSIASSKAYKQVAMRQLCKYVKVPADAWRGLAESELAIMESLASNIVAYGQLTPKQWGLAKRIISTHRQ